MTRTVAFLITFALIAGSGAIAGLWTNRWHTSLSGAEAAHRLAQVPLDVDGWDATPYTLTDREVKQGDLDGYLHRKYVHRKTGESVTVLVVCGRSGPICVHTPEVCYGNSGYAQTATLRYQPKGELPVDMSVMEFRKANVAVPSELRLFLAWGTKQGWSAPKQPRLTFVKHPVLFKIYVIREVPKLLEKHEEDVATELIQSLLPMLQEHLFPEA
jgi:hypothetical protein